MTNRTKGGSYETRARRLLEALGYRVHQARVSLFWKNGHPIVFAYDLHRAFDMNAIHARGPDLHVQVTVHAKRGARQQKVLVAVDGTEGNPHHFYEVWSFGKQERLGFHIHVERLVARERWVLVGNYRYDGTALGRVKRRLVPRGGS